MENKTLNIILGIVSIVVILIIGYMINLIAHNESDRIYFKLSEFKDVVWTNEEEAVTFKIDGRIADLTIGEKIVLSNDEIVFDDKTGEIQYLKNNDWHSGEIYIRSVADDSLVLWYDKAEYRLTREIKYE